VLESVAAVGLSAWRAKIAFENRTPTPKVELAISAYAVDPAKLARR